MRVLDSRRLTGPNLLLDRAGAVLDIELSDAERDRALAAWRAAATRLLDAVGWHGQVLAMRSFAGGASVAFTAPADALYAATDLNEAAWASAQAGARGYPGSRHEPPPSRISAPPSRPSGGRRCPRCAMRPARAGSCSCTGRSRCRSARAPVSPSGPTTRSRRRRRSIGAGSHDVPIALVTGSNGKTTTVRLLAAMAKAAGRVAGLTSTDGVAVGGRQIGEGDYSGPSGARLLLRDSAVEVAVLETARGGLLRRGLTVERADVAVVTNIADDHLGEFGVQDLTTLAETKLLIARAIGAEGRVVLNADDPVLVAASRDLTAPIAWFSLDAANPVVTEHVARGGRAAVLRGDEVTLLERGHPVVVAKTSEIPIAIGGAARYNVANALAAVLAAGGLGLPFEAIGETLRRFGTDPADNPGRANLFEVGGVKVLLDYAHNPHGMEALAAAAAGVPSKRRLVMLGQAGDRSDEAIRDLARSVMALRPDRVVAKEMDRYLRGRAAGEIPGILADEFRQLGLSEAQISAGDVEIRAVEKALEWARPGDLLILAVHQDRPVVATLLDRLRRTGWKAGEPLPR